MRVMLKDSPFTDAKAVLVTFSEVSAHHDDSGWSTVPFASAAGATVSTSSRTCDLKKLETAQDILGTGPLPAGHYTQLRLVVSSAKLYFDAASEGAAACAPIIAAPSGRSATVDIPSGEIKLNREFTLAQDGGASILVDFDGNRSIRDMGNGRYSMSPVISIQSVN